MSELLQDDFSFKINFQYFQIFSASFRLKQVGFKNENFEIKPRFGDVMDILKLLLCFSLSLLYNLKKIESPGEL